MNRKLVNTIIKAVLSVILVGLVTASVVMVASGRALDGTFFALVPPIVAIALALLTKEAYSSLFIGVILAGLFANAYNPVGSLDTVINDGLISAVSDSAGIFIFLVILGIFVALVNASGSSRAFGQWAKKHIHTKVGALLATFVLGVLIFIDDYFNCLTVGSVMRPVTDRHNISRPKLAYIIDATAAPICMIAPVSSWAAAVSSYASGTEMSGIGLFVKAIPYNFYSLLTIIFVIALSVMNFDYGPMKRFEKKAQDGDLSILDGAISDEESSRKTTGRVFDLILPILVLIVFCVVGLIYVGGFFGGASFIDAFGDTDAYVGLPWGALLALIFTIIYMIARRVLTFENAMKCIPKGFNAMVPAILILTLATSLKNITNILGGAAYVAALTESAAGFLMSMLPAIIFLIACGLAFATGTSWGTFGILIPIVIAVFPASSPLFIIGISACLAGAVCGDHCSPISDTTIMSSAGAQCNHIEHVTTQIPYALTVAVISFVTYVIAGLIQNLWSLVIGILLTVGTLFIMKLRSDKKYAK